MRRKFPAILVVAAAIALTGCPSPTPLQTPVAENPSGESASLLISAFSPRSGGPGTVVTITGTGFDGKVPSNNLVMFNGVPGVVTSATETTLVATVPEGASFGTISVTVNGKVATSADAYAAQLNIKTIMGAHLPDAIPANEVSLEVQAIAMDAHGNMYAAAGHAIFKISPAGILSKLAGNGLPGDMGDGGLALDARLREPGGVAVDAAGNVYLADTYNNRVRKVTPDGKITTVAGTGSEGDSGDGGPATSAQLDEPQGLAVDASGNLYIADTDNCKIRKVTPDGKISTVAGTGRYGNSGNGGKATSAELAYPRDVAVDDSGNLYIADSNSRMIRKVSAADGTISAFAGTGVHGYSGDGGAATSARLKYPDAVSVDASGNVYIGDTEDYRVRKVSAADGTIETVAGSGNWGSAGDGGLATGAQLYPNSLGVDAAGNLYIADSSSNRIRKVSASNQVITSVAGGAANWVREGDARQVFLWEPVGMAEDSQGNLYVGMAAGVVYKLTPGGQVTRVAGTGDWGDSGDGGPARDAQLKRLGGLALDASDNLYIADSENNRIRKVSANGTITTVAGNGTWGFEGDGGAATDAKLDYPRGLTLDDSGNLYISDSGNHRIRKVSPEGTITTVAGYGTEGFGGDGGPATAALLAYPEGVGVDASGNLYIADTYNNRIRKVSANGTITTVAGNGTEYLYYNNYRLASLTGQPAVKTTLFAPSGISLDKAGNVYFAEAGASAIRRLSPSGLLSTVAGGGVPGFAGDNGPAIHARLGRPQGVLVGRSGNLYVADTENSVIRSIGF